MAKVHNAELLASDDLVVKLTNLNGDWEQGVVPSDPNSVVSGELGDLVVQENDGAIWKNTDGVTEWKQILAGREVYAFNGAPSGTPDNLDAVAYDYSTGELYYWDPVALAWETAAGNVLDWHQTATQARHRCLLRDLTMLVRPTTWASISLPMPRRVSRLVTPLTTLVRSRSTLTAPTTV
jgi:hypothetical protein